VGNLAVVACLLRTTTKNRSSTFSGKSATLPPEKILATPRKTSVWQRTVFLHTFTHLNSHTTMHITDRKNATNQATYFHTLSTIQRQSRVPCSLSEKADGNRCDYLAILL